MAWKKGDPFYSETCGLGVTVNSQLCLLVRHNGNGSYSVEMARMPDDATYKVEQANHHGGTYSQVVALEKASKMASKMKI